jgi:peroxiredoxin
LGEVGGGAGGPLLARLTGQPLPVIELPSTSDQPIDLSGLDRGVVYFYSGNLCSPEDGYDSAALDEAQHRAFANHWSDFAALKCLAFGVSSQSPDQQRQTGDVLGLGHPLLSDGGRRLAYELGLPTFTVDNATWYCRLTLVVGNGLIAHAFYPVASATRSAAQAIAWMRRRQWN